MSKQPQIPRRPMITRSCPSSSIAHDHRGRGRKRFLKWFFVAVVLFTSGHALYAQGAADALFIDEKGNLTIGTTTFIYQSGNAGIGTLEPKSSLSVAGGVAVGNSYAKSNPASANDLLVEGNVGIGTPKPKSSLSVAGGLAVGNSYAESNPASANDLLVEGNVGIGVIGKPKDKLEVAGNLRILTNDGANPLRFTSEWSAFPDGAGIINQAEIANDTKDYKTLMIVGNKSGGGDTRRVGVWDDLKVAGNLTVTKTINGEKPPLVFEVGKKGDVGNWNAVDQDIGPLCGDADGCTMKFMLRDNSNDQVRTISEQMYIEQPDKSSNKNPGLHGWSRQLGGGGESEFVLQTSNKYELVPYPWKWIYVRNYSSPEVGTQSGAYSGYKVQFMTAKNVAATVIIYDR